jgi:hypothetical protein
MQPIEDAARVRRARYAQIEFLRFVTLTGRSQTFREILDRMEPRGVAEFRSILYRGRKAI